MWVSCVVVKTSGGVGDVTVAVTERELEVVGVHDDMEGDIVGVGVREDVAAAAIQMDDTISNITTADLLAAAANLLLLFVAISTRLVWILSSHTVPLYQVVAEEYRKWFLE